MKNNFRKYIEGGASFLGFHRPMLFLRLFQCVFYY